MAELALSVVMPVFNEAPHLPETIGRLVAALEGSWFDAELIVVDDGSTDGSGEVAGAAVAGKLPVRVLEQPNRGRFEARRRGLTAATSEYVLFLDARVGLHRDGLCFVRARVDEGRHVWNAHVYVRADGRFGAFWGLVAELAWRDYFDRPRTTSFGLEDFDRYPKGTTCFFAPRALLVSAFGEFTTRYGDIRLANDDTPILRALAARARIGISPHFACDYAPRETVVSFLRHAFRRGVVFVDGHGTPASRFFWPTVAFFPLSAAVAVAALRRPAIGAAALAGTGVGAAAYGRRARRLPDEVATLALVTPLYALAHGAGMWRGLAELVRNRIAPSADAPNGDHAAPNAASSIDSALSVVTEKQGSDPGLKG